VKALITGAAGQLGGLLVAAAPQHVKVRGVDHAQCDITDCVAVDRIVDSFEPDVVINAAAYTAVDAAEKNRDLAFDVNAEGARNLAKAAARTGARILQISTDYVFDGRTSRPYSPDAPTNPLSIYGASKLEGERLTLQAAPDAVVIRAGWLYSQRGKNFLVTILSLIKGTRPLRVVRDQVGCPTSAFGLAQVIWKSCEKIPGGTYHWANRGSASWYDFAVEIAKLAIELRIVPRTPEITPVTTKEYAAAAPRPRYSALDSTRLSEALGISPADWSEALRLELTRAYRNAHPAGRVQ
jgi:dTDP-4-dehydrorhamnose reductase